MTVINTDVCVIGAGAAGLSVASGTTQLGLKTVLIEQGKMGGDCLNTGCVPSKSMLSLGAQVYKTAQLSGTCAVDIDFSDVHYYITESIKTIAPHDSQERFESLGVTVLRDTAKFINRSTLQVGEHTVQARYFVIATGARPAIPEISGLKPALCYTSETLFTHEKRPEHLVVIGGGAIGLEMAQAHRRLGSRVTILESGCILPRMGHQAAGILREKLSAEGIVFFENATVTSVHHANNQSVTIHFNHDDHNKNTIEGTHILLATGRQPNLDVLSLDKAGVASTKHGITVNQKMQTTNKRIFALGDVSGGPQLTHAAGYQAGIIIRNICFKIPAKTDYSALPQVIYTSPEIAIVGLNEKEARTQYKNKIKTVEVPFTENDRAVTERQTDGYIRIITTKRGRILGACIIAPHAGELITLWTLAISARIKISKIAEMIAPYPTYSEISKTVAGQWYKDSLFSNKTRGLVRLLQKFTR